MVEGSAEAAPEVDLGPGRTMMVAVDGSDMAH